MSAKPTKCSGEESGQAACNCPECWRTHRSCHRSSPNQRCRRCTGQIIKGENDTLAAIKHAPSYPHDQIIVQFHNHSVENRSFPINDDVLAYSCVRIQVESASISDISLSRTGLSVECQGTASFQNFDITPLEQAILDRYSGDLKAKYSDDKLISYALRTGALLHVLSSASDIRGKINTFQNGIYIENVYLDGNIGLDLRRKLANQVGNYIERIMNIFRRTCHGADDDSLQVDAAAIVLYTEVDYFTRSLRSGELSAKVPEGLEGPFLEWLTSVATELKNRILEGCGRFLDWRSRIQGSWRKSRRSYDPLRINIICHRYKAIDPAEAAVRLEFYQAANTQTELLHSRSSDKIIPPEVDLGYWTALPEFFVLPDDANTYAQSYVSSSTNSPEQEPPLLMHDNFSSPTFNPSLDQFTGDTMIYDMLEDSSFESLATSSFVPNEWSFDAGSPQCMMNPNGVDKMTVDEQALDPRLLSKDCHLEFSFTRALN